VYQLYHADEKIGEKMLKILFFLVCLALSSAAAFEDVTSFPTFEDVLSLIPVMNHRVHMTQHTLPTPITWSLKGNSSSELREVGVEFEIRQNRSNLIHSSRQIIVTRHAEWKSGVFAFNHTDIDELPISVSLSLRIRVILVKIEDMKSNSSTYLKTSWSTPVPWMILPESFISSTSPFSSWICTSPTGSVDTRSSMLRTEFTTPQGLTITSAVLHITGLGQFRVYVNGYDILGSIWNVPGQTDWKKRVLVNSINIDPSIITLNGKSNAVGVILGNGMYNVPDPSSRYTKWVGSFGPRMLLFSMVIIFNDGSNTTINSDSSGSWDSTDDGPISFSHEYAGEDYNASKEVTGWSQGDFKTDSNPLVQWSPAQDCSNVYPGGSLFPSLFDDVSVVDTLPAISIVPSSPASTMLVDVGRNFAGYASVSLLNLPTNYTVRIWPSETMQNGKINQASGGTPMYWQFFPSAYSVPTTINITISPTFSIYGWRWLAVELIDPQSNEINADTKSMDNDTVTVLQASYGLVCNPDLAGDVTQAVATFCNTLSSCTFTVCVCGDNTCGAGTPPCIQDPAQNCAKDFTATWRCTNDPAGFNRTRYLPAEADNHELLLDCGAPPPPPPLPPPSPLIAAATGHFVRASAPVAGTWKSSNEWVNRIHNITVEAIASNLQSVLTDCPHRERLGWLEVSWLMFPSIAFNFDISRLWSKIALDTVDSQLPNGMVPDIAPEYTVFSGGFRDSPEWGSASLQNPGFLLEWYSNEDIIQKTYNTSVAYLNYLLSQVNQTSGLLEYGLGDWVPVVGSPPGVTPTGTLVQDLQVLSKAAGVLGLPIASANYSALAKAYGEAYERAYFSPPPATNTYPTQAAAGYALALNFSTNISLAQSYLLNDVITRGNVTTAGEVGNRYAMLGLAATDDGLDALWASLLRTDAPGYGVMLTLGETALAESWYDDGSMSHIHAMYGHIDEIFYGYYAGFQQEQGSIGWRRVKFVPHPLFSEGTGAWVNATYNSPRGLLTSHSIVTSSTAGKRKVNLAFTCPVGVDCTVMMPLSKRIVHVPGIGEEISFQDFE